MYEAILRLPHHTSLRHKRMSMLSRAAQFAPFAALTGYEERVMEAARLTDAPLELTEEEQETLNAAMQYLLSHASERPPVQITYFQPDPRKAGGMYVTVQGAFRFWDQETLSLELTDRTSIPLAAVYGIRLLA